MFVQGNAMFEKMLKMGKDHGDMTGVENNLKINASSSTQRPNNVFVRAKKKAQTSP